MKVTFPLAVLLALSMSSASARTWTSADGSKTFEGELRSFNPNTGVVTVLVNGRVMNFTQDKLSKEDIAFLKESGSSKSDSDAAAKTDSESEIGAKVAKAKLHKLDGERYKKAAIEKAPKYYVLYYSASW